MRLRATATSGYRHASAGGALRPTLDLRFAEYPTLDPRITFTRASTATFFNSAGVLTSAAVDAPRFDYNPSTLAAQGLLLEEARTNILLRSTLAGAVAGSPGTAPTGWNTGTFSGTPTLALATSIYGASDQALNYSGVSGDRLWHQQVINVVDGTTYTYSAYCETSSGSTKNVLEVISGTSTRTVISNTATDPVGGAGVRVQVVFSVVGTGTITLRIGIGANTPLTGAASVTLSRPQVEAGAFPTSYIPTTTTALTREAHVASVNTLSPWYNATEGTLYSEATFTNTASFNTTAALSDGTTSNAIRTIQWNDGTDRIFSIATGGVSQASYIGTGQIGTAKFAGAYKLNDVNASKNGSIGITDTAATIPTVNALWLGATGSSLFLLNGYLRRITYYPRRLSNAELQAITT